jgi:hypothetical protein
MRKEKNIFLLGILIIASLLISGCSMSASDGVVATSTNDQLGQILGAVASQEPVDKGTTPEPTEDSIPTPEVPAADVVEETPEPTPTATLPPVEVDKTVPTSYTLHEGEFPWCLARRFNLNPTGLLNANGIPVGQSYFQAGLVITIPDNLGPYEGTRQLRSHSSPYTVKTGDTFYSIACHYGDLWPEEIAAANGMEMNDSLPAGTDLIIP